jgi:uncharacterized RDD family membrane protein YckC
MIHHGAAYVCGKCKPVFLQKLAEGAEISTGLRYASFWSRVGALVLDSIVLFVIGFGLQLLLGIAIATQTTRATQVPVAILLLQQLIGFVIAILYETIFIGRFGATLGKMAAKIHVVTAEGGRVTYLRAFARYFAKLVSAFTLLIGYLMAAFDTQGRALHDRICNTRVVMD